MTVRPAAAVATLMALTGGTACGSAIGATPAASSGTAPLSGPLTVFAAASLSDAFAGAEKTLEAGHPGFKGSYSFAGSQQLVVNVQNGAPSDVIATADMRTMQKLVAAGLVETPRAFARNTLEIAVAPGNPKRITGVASLAAPRVSVVLADPSVPAGNFAEQVLHRAGVTVVPTSRELDVRSALEKVISGDADAAIVYSTDVASAGGAVSGVAIPDGQNVIATYPIAVVKGTEHHATAAAFVQEAVSGGVQRALRGRGFLAP